MSWAGEGHTHWSQLILPGDPEQAWRYFYERYRGPVAALFRHRGVASSDLEDLVHEFFVVSLEREFLSRADPERGRFRGYLATAAGRFLSSHRRAEGRQRRRPEGGPVLPLDEGFDVAAKGVLTPEEAFDLAWARAVFARARTEVQEHYRSKSKLPHFEAFQLREAGESWPAIAERLDASQSAVRGWVDRVSDRMARCVREEISGTVPDQEGLDQELEHLSQILAKGS